MNYYFKGLNEAFPVARSVAVKCGLGRVWSSHNLSVLFQGMRIKVKVKVKVTFI